MQIHDTECEIVYLIRSSDVTWQSVINHKPAGIEQFCLSLFLKNVFIFIAKFSNGLLCLKSPIPCIYLTALLPGTLKHSLNIFLI